MRKLIAVTLLFSLMFISDFSMAQHRIKRTNLFSSYKSPSQKTGISAAYAYKQHSKCLCPMAEVYYMNYLTRFMALGANYGVYFDSGYAQMLTASFSLIFFDKLHLSFTPGIKFNELTNITYFMGVKAEYQLNISEKVYWSPNVYMAIFQDDNFVAAGLSLGYMF